MQLLFVLLTLCLVAVAVFALQNAAPVTIRFLHWETESSVALVTIVAVAFGAMCVGLLGLASRIRRWGRPRSPWHGEGAGGPPPRAGGPAGSGRPTPPP